MRWIVILLSGAFGAALCMAALVVFLTVTAPEFEPGRDLILR